MNRASVQSDCFALLSNPSYCEIIGFNSFRIPMRRKKRTPNSVKGSPWKLSKRVFQVEDEFLKQAQNAARAKTLCAKFEHWEETDGKTTTSNQHIAEMEIAQNSSGEQLSIESASSLRARFESLGSQTNESPRTPKVKVNRFVVSTLS